MKAIIGLGNIGKEYLRTRHNAGFLALEYLREQWNFPLWQGEKKFRGASSMGQVAEQKVLLFQPHTMMNASGEAVALIAQFYKLSPTDLIVLHDDLDIAAGTLRQTDSSRAAGHNGVQSLIDHLGTQDFTRLRIGIGRPARNATHSVAGGPTEVLGVCEPSHDYVLKNFGPEEWEKLQKLFPEIERIVREKFV